jgi:hypothetical protein
VRAGLRKFFRMNNITDHHGNSKYIASPSAEIRPAGRENRARRQKLLKSITLSGEFPTATLLPATLAGIFVHRRYAVPAELADFIAAAAGLGGSR